MRGGERLDRQASKQAVIRALRDGVSVEEGRRRVAQENWAAAQAQLSQVRCGTAAPINHDQAERPLQWWQRD